MKKVLSQFTACIVNWPSTPQAVYCPGRTFDVRDPHVVRVHNQHTVAYGTEWIIMGKCTLYMHFDKCYIC